MSDRTKRQIEALTREIAEAEARGYGSLVAQLLRQKQRIMDGIGEEHRNRRQQAESRAR